MVSTDGEVLGERPSHAYYRACHGAWRCPLALRVTDGAALRDSGMALGDRLGLRMMAMWPRWLGRFFLETSVRYDAGGDVIHTTVVRWLGIAMMRSTERIVLDPDGRAFRMEGEQRVLPAVWVRRRMQGTGRIDAEGTRAEYEMDWMGARMRQSTVRDPDRVTVTQQGPGFAGVQTLVRQAPRPP